MQCERCGNDEHGEFGICPVIINEKRYIQIEIMLPADGEGLTSEAWEMYERMRKDWEDYFFNRNVRISNPFTRSRPELKHWEN